jgi:hypothetical protein
MKTSISAIGKLLVLVLVLIVITSSRKTAKAAEPTTITLLAGVKDISKIEVSGNVEILLSQQAEEQLKVYDEYYSKNALVQWEDGVLRISSYENKKLTVLVGVNHLKVLVVSGDAVVRSVNRLSSIDLEVYLKDNAVASISAQALNMSTTLSDNARLELSGQAENQLIALSEASQLEAGTFEARNQTFSVSDSAIAAVGSTEVRSSAMLSGFSRSF